MKEGTSAVLLQSGLDGKWWADSMGCFTYLRNIQDLLSDGKTHVRDVSGNQLKDRSFRLIHRLSHVDFVGESEGSLPFPHD